MLRRSIVLAGLLVVGCKDEIPLYAGADVPTDGPAVSGDGGDAAAPDAGFDAGAVDAGALDDVAAKDAPALADRSVEDAAVDAGAPFDAPVADAPVADAPTAAPGECSRADREGSPGNNVDSDLADSQSPSVVWTGTEFGVAWSDLRNPTAEIYFARFRDATTPRVTLPTRTSAPPSR